MSGWMRLQEFRNAFRLQTSYAEAPDPKQGHARALLLGDGEEGAGNLLTHSAPSSFLTYASEHSWQKPGT